METNCNKVFYEAPSTRVIDVRHEGIICGSDVRGMTEGGNENYFRNDPEEW